MLNKSLFTAIIKSAGNAGSCGRMAAVAVNKYSGTYYTYDIHGNVDTLLQDYRNGVMSNHGYNRFKEITYNYDLISGKVNEVDYQPGAVDQFYHRYDYDAENRITDVYTSDHKAYVGHKNLEDHEAFYEYYKHGPLARSVIGQQQVQGIDYAYTLQGWLKGVNSTALNPVYDMGGDGNLVAKDAYSFGLNYFQNDYAPINSTVSPFPGFSGLFPTGYSYKPLYNGNISAMSVNISKLNNPLLYNYQYDQLNRLVAMDAFTGLDTSNNTWHTLTTDNSYQERVSYDANGNIQKYLRNGTIAGGTPLGIDSLTYKYNRDAVGQLINNQLSSVNDSVPAGNYLDDIDNQSDNNYGYDAIGNMTSDAAGGINNITWTVYGKIATITKTDGSTVAYTYDAAGNRISKTVTPKKGKATTTWYVRDAGGNTMAVYTATGSDSLRQTEQHLYGSSRIGIFNRNINADAALPTGTSANLIGNYVISYFTRGNKNYEGDNHLGNVLITFTDKKFGIDTNGDGIVDYYIADVVSANDYYPFGMLMPGRTYNSTYRYTFNGKELDRETGLQDYGMRMYAITGRFISVDPVAAAFPFLSTYQYSSNNPIAMMDIDGKESKPAMIIHDERTTILATQSSTQVQSGAREASMKLDKINQLIPKLVMPRKDYTFLNENEKQTILKETVSNYLSFNYTEKISTRFSGKLDLTQTITGDLNYSKLFGKHTNEKVPLFEKLFSINSSIAEILPDAEHIPAIGYGKNTLTGIEIIKNLQEGEYEKAKLDAVKAGAEIGVSFAIKQAVKNDVLPEVAGTFLNAGMQTIVNTLSSLEAGNGSTINGNIAAQKKIETQDYKRTVISSLLFYFLSGNKLEITNNTETIKKLQNENRSVQDNVPTHN